MTASNGCRNAWSRLELCASTMSLIMSNMNITHERGWLAGAPSFLSLRIRVTVHPNFVHVSPTLTAPGPVGQNLTVCIRLCKVGSDFGANLEEVSS